MRLADQIRAFVAERYIAPARRGNTNTQVTILAGDVVRDLKLVQRTPAVCSALDTKLFLNENNLVPSDVRRTGPKFGPMATWNVTV
jgi:hypothetical protein